MASSINADNGVVSGSSGLKSTADTSGVLALQTNGTTAVTVDTSQNVGVGVTPSSWSVAYPNIFQTKGGSIFGDPASSEGNFGVNVYYNSGYKYAANGYVSIYQQYNAQHIFKTAVTGTAGNAVTLTNSLVFGKGTTLALEGATTQTGTGITFPATQSASSDANTLDDYEEGTWTPTYSGGLSGVSYGSVQAGYYRKIGSQVTIWFGVMTNGLTVTSSALQITGLPFTSASGSGSNGAVTLANVTRWVSSPPLVGVIELSSTSITLYSSNNATGAGTDPVTTTTGNMATGSGNRNLCFGTATYSV